MGNQQVKERRDYERKIDWKKAERPSPPGKPYLVQEDSNSPTDVITIRWSPPISDGGAPIIGYLVEHRRTGSPHWLRATPDLILNMELPLTGLEPGWRYQFRVSAENDIGRSDPGELSEPLTVTFQKLAASAPFFNLELQDTIGLENEKVEFKVHVIAVPTPTIAWYKDGFEIFSSRRTKITTENDQSVFIIHQAALEDEGEIKCTATNRAGYAVTKANLKLEAPPRIRLPRQYEDGLIFEKGELIRLKVTIAGRPRPEVFWYHNGELLQKNERIEMAFSETGSVVKIRNACREDRGEYVIKGVNKIGEDIVFFLVTVTDRPSPPGKVQTTAMGRMVMLSWSCPEDDGGCKIGSYIVEYFRVGWDMWLKAKNSRQLSTILENLIEGSEYKFRVRAENPYGISEPGEESDVIFIPDLKRGILKPPPKSLTSELLKETKRHATNVDETEESKKRRLLEEKARRLLDVPLSVLLPYENDTAITQNEESTKNDESVPPSVPKRKKGKGRLTLSPVDVSLSNGQRKTPRLTDESVDETRLIPSLVDSKFSNKTFGTEEEINGTVEKPNWNFQKESLKEERFLKFKEQNPFNEEGPLYPRENDDSIMHGSSELMLVIYPRDRSKSIELSAQQRSEIEMNLSGDGIAPPMSLSAPELGCTEFYEPLMRDAISSTELLYERTAARLYQDRIDEEAQRLVKRRYSMDRKSVERRASLKESLEKRLSFKGNQEEEKIKNQTEPSEKSTKQYPTRQTDEFQSQISTPLGKESKEKLSSVEREQLEFAMVRNRLKQKDEEQKFQQIVLDHGSETSTTTATLSSVETEELEDEYEGEFLEEEEKEEDYLDDDKKERETDDDYDNNLGFKKQISKMSIIDTSLTLPKPIKIAPFAEREEDIYHFRTMIPTRSAIQLTAEEVKINPASQSGNVRLPSSSQSEIKPKNQTSEIKTSKIPIPSKTKKTSKILKKFSLKKDKKIPEVTLTPVDSEFPSTVLPKPILKNKTLMGKRKESPKTILKLSHIKPIDKSISEEESEGEFAGRKKKQVRISEPNKETMEKQKKPMDENAIENQVLIYHYSDIVKEFGGNKKPASKLYLNYEELKAHAKEPEKTNSVPHQVENKFNHTVTENVRNEKTLEKLQLEVNLVQKSEPEILIPQNSKTDIKIHSSLEYLTDIAMFIIACCLYLFKNELYAIPILVIMTYRQLKVVTVKKYENFKNSLSKIIPKKLKGKAKNENSKEI